MAPGQSTVIRSSLPYQILLYCNGWYSGAFVIAELLVFIYKGETLPYARGNLPAEIILLLLLGCLEGVRLFLGQKGNLTERGMAVGLSLVLSMATLVGFLYLTLWQTYVLRLEVILTGIGLAFIGLELIFGLISIISFARAAPYG
ncbi:PREDICTED: transmembrane protein 216-like [Priapulus caudatus]|uniref:Transmembrane protein 216-like n=1 Tax=Priapulus caudatus TaxID=37621 RepID=A0ABM1DXL8_PRICU|nr:PREDICTED: transmembrane protein 216-like [Priapulus caudatus]